MIEGWGLAAAAVVAGGAIVGSAISSSAQSGAASTAANAETTAANEQASTQASIANAQLGIESPTREIGGLAQQQLAYELGLSPDLNISTAFQTPEVNTNGSINWVNGSGAPGSGSTAPNGPSTGAAGSTFAYNSAGQPIQVNNSSVPGTALTTTPQTGSTGPNTGEGGYGSLIENPFQNPANLTLSPAYQFDLSQGESVLNNQAAAAGHTPVSTGTEDAEQQYVQGLALNTYSTAFNQAQSEQQMNYNELAGAAGEAQIGNAGADSALESGGSGISGAQGAAGSAQAAGAIGQGNAITSGIGTGLNTISSLLNGSGSNSNISNYLNGFTQSPYGAGANQLNYLTPPSD
jgi:hypothetical protein